MIEITASVRIIGQFKDSQIQAALRRVYLGIFCIGKQPAIGRIDLLHLSLVAAHYDKIGLRKTMRIAVVLGRKSQGVDEAQRLCGQQGSLNNPVLNLSGIRLSISNET